MDKIEILGISGSLRKKSYNTALLKNAQEFSQPWANIEIFDRTGELPLFNQDLVEQGKAPKVVGELKKAIRASDAILFATPEYNYSVSGVLKNLIDWASRPPADNAFEGKPAAIIGASTGMIGTARAQEHLRQIGVFVNLNFINKPHFMVAFATDKFDEFGRLTDDKARGRLKDLIQALTEWTHRLTMEPVM